MRSSSKCFMECPRCRSNLCCSLILKNLPVHLSHKTFITWMICQLSFANGHETVQKHPEIKFLRTLLCAPHVPLIESDFFHFLFSEVVWSFYEKGVCQNSAKFKEKQLCMVLFFVRLDSFSLQLYLLTKTLLWFLQNF